MNKTHRIRMTLQTLEIKQVLFIDGILSINGDDQTCDNPEVLYEDIIDQLDRCDNYIYLDYMATEED